MTITHPKVGNDAALLYNTAIVSGEPNYTEPLWVEVLAAGNVNISTLEVSMAEVVTRNGDWATNLAAKFRAEVEFQYLWGEDTEMLQMLIDAFWSRRPRDFAVMDNDFNAVTTWHPADVGKGEGLRGMFFLASMPRNEPNEEAIMVDGFRLAPALQYSDVDYKTKINAMWYSIDPSPLVTAQGGPGLIPFNASPETIAAIAKSSDMRDWEVERAVKSSKMYRDSLTTIPMKDAVKYYDPAKYRQIAHLAKTQPLRPAAASHFFLDKQSKKSTKS